MNYSRILEVYESWLNGNISWSRNQLRKVSTAEIISSLKAIEISDKDVLKFLKSVKDV